MPCLRRQPERDPARPAGADPEATRRAGHVADALDLLNALGRRLESASRALLARLSPDPSSVRADNGLAWPAAPGVRAGA